ncbi:MAG: 4-alpha-glucanotransferase [Ruminococcaceae bacterium]|nr:4-alpha-glucanotransferase [Oscillospiraceae bacterium]
MKRSSGILMPIFSLPSPYGIGTLGKAAYDFIDFLAAAGQSYWQILPVGPTSYGDSPYQSFSTFAGNPYFIDLDLLIKEGLLKKSEVTALDWGNDSEAVDYEKVYNNRFQVLRKAFARGFEKDRAAFAAFEKENAWLEDYALYMAVKKHFGMQCWTEWEEEAIRLHKPEAVRQYREKLSEDVAFYAYLQFLFYNQWEKLRAYAKENCIGIIGDVPIYVALDSADVWANPKYFQLDEKNIPLEVAGVPPDYFSEDGQLWGNPLYNWEYMKAEGYGWWIRRIDGAGKLYDVVRIDHFRGFESYWAVPYGEKTAKKGKWVKGPGIELVKTLTNWFPQISFIAEDLGILTEDVRMLLKESELPGMKVLEFAFNGKDASNYMPHRFERNCVCYTGTHDNTTLAAWLKEAAPKELAQVKKYLGLNSAEGFRWGVIRGGMSSTAALFMAQMQDYLGLGASARINTPGTDTGNWRWRLQKGAATKQLAKKIAEITARYER